MKNWIFPVLVVAVCCLGSCQEAERAEKVDRIALVPKTLNNPFFSSLREGAEEAAAEAGVDLIVQAAEREVDVDRQREVIEELIEMGVDLLMIDPIGTGEVLPAILKANQAGIPVVILDTRIDPVAASNLGIKIESFVGSDNFRGGLVAGQYILDQMSGNARVAILEGIPGHETADSRLQGFLTALEGHEGIEIVASQPANWEQEMGRIVTQEVLNESPDLNVIFACNDLMALGAIEAISSAGKTGQIAVVGFDAVEEARLAIAEAAMLASVAQLPSEIGRIGLETGVRILAGEEVPDEIPVRIELITRENLYHLEW